MNRLEFIKLAGAALLAPFLPQLEPGDEPMELYRLLEKIGRGQRLSENELMDMRNQVRALEETKDLVKDWVTSGTNQPIFQAPMETIYSTILSVDTASLSISIPNKYNHLLVFGAGRTTGAGTSSQYLRVQFSGDTGANYINQFFTAVAAVLTGTRVTGQTHGILGILSEGGRPAGDVGSFYALLPHYNNSDLNKNIMSTMTLPFGSLIQTASNWDSTSPITSLTIFSAADDIEAGSIISVYGIK